MKRVLAASLLVASVLPAGPAMAGACVHDHIYMYGGQGIGYHGGSPHAHFPECHDSSPQLPDSPPQSKADQHRRNNQQRTSDGQLIGGCGLLAVTDTVAGEGQMTGLLDIEAAFVSRNPVENPLTATITCYVRVNGATQAGAVVTASGVGTAGGGGVVTYTSNSVDDFVELCQDVSYSNGVNTRECLKAESVEIPPAIAWEALCPMLTELNEVNGPVIVGESCLPFST